MTRFRVALLILLLMALTACATAPETVAVFEGAQLPTRQPTPTPADLIEGTLSAAYPLPVKAVLAPNVPLTDDLTADFYARLYTIQGRAGDLLTIDMTARGALDTVLLLAAPDGREIARNDDRSDSSRDARLTVELPTDGAYTLVATRYRGRFSTEGGDFTINLTAARATDEFTPPTTPLSCDTTRDGRITDSQPAQAYSFYADAQTVVTVDMRSDDAVLDPSLRLTDSLGTEIATNEDVNPVTNYDAALVNITLPTAGYYTLIATRYPNEPTVGSYTLSLTCDDVSVLATNEQAAYLDDDQSRTLLDRIERILGTAYYVGDLMNVDLEENEVNVPVQSILTYHLPPLNGNAITSATLDLSSCDEVGLGWDVVESVTVYGDSVGRISGLTPFAPSDTAQDITTLTACGVVDVTASVQQAIEAGESVVQFRVLPSNTDEENGQDDALALLDPRLILTTTAPD